MSIKQDFDTKYEDDGIAAYCLTNLTTVLDLVFRCFNAKQLSTVSKVCTFWNHTAKRLKSKRNFFVTELVCSQEDDEDQASSSLIQDSLKQFINDSPILPTVALLYTCDCAFKYMDNERQNSKFVNKIYKALPPKCFLVGCEAGGVIGCSSGQSLEYKDNVSGSMMLLPSKENVHVKQFVLSTDAMEKAGKDPQKWRRILGFPTDHKTKLVILHASSCDPDDIKMAIKMIIKIAGSDVVIAGGMANLTFANRKSYEERITGIAFAGDLTANIIIHKDDKDKTGMISELTKLKNSAEVDANTVMFMFSCVARDPSLHLKNASETSWIKQVFPQIPVIGMFAFGEIAYDPNSNDSKYKRKTNIYQFTTVLCLCRF